MLQNISKMKTKLIAMQWRGSASVDPRFSAAMLPWSIADIYSRDQFLNVSTYPSTYLYYSEFESTEKKE